MPKKRPLDDEDRQKLARGLQVHGASERAVHSLWNIFCDDKRVGRGTFTDVVQEEFKPWQDVTTQVPFE
jgi:DNA primase catalytic subunit